jgi:hypothetical protein
MGMPSPALIAALSSPSPTSGDIAQAVRAGSPREIAIGGRVIAAHTGPSDPRGAEAVALVTEELKRQGAADNARRG